MAVLFHLKAVPQAKVHTVRVSPDLAKPLALAQGERVTVQVGRRSLPVHVTVGGKGPKRIQAHPALLQHFGLPVTNSEIRLRARRNGSYLRMGPVIGIFVNRIASSSGLFGSANDMAKLLCLLGSRRGFFVYAFTPEGIRWSSAEVSGYRPIHGRWTRRRCPFPDVVYDRIQGRTAERSRSVRRARSRMIRWVGDRYFNRRFFDKWEIHQLLAGDPELMPHLPATEKYAGAAHVAERVRRWGGAWLKPRGGSLGRGIMIVRAREGGRFLVYLQRRGIWRSVRVRGVRSLGALLRRSMKSGGYIVQQELSLARYRGQPFDVRILIQRRGDGDWRRSKLYARVAPRRGMTTNIAQGGRGVSFRQTAKRASGALPGMVDSVLQTMQELSQKILERIESGSGEKLGEIALDLGIDQQGHVWFIEANSKPFRSVQTETGDMRIVRRALVRPLLYASHLAGFGDRPAGGNHA